MSMQNDYLKLSEIAGKGKYQGKDYKDKNGHWVLFCDAEFWEETGKQEGDFPVFAHVDMRKDGWTPDPKALYKAREHWVTTIEPFRVVTPKEEREKIKQRQEEIYWGIVNEYLESYKTDFLAGLKNAPDENGFLEVELEEWRNCKFSREVVKGYRNFDKIVPRSIEEKFPIVKGKPNNYQPKEEARYLFFKWLEKYQSSNEATPPPPTSTETKTERETPIFTNNFDKIAATEIYEHFKILVEKGYLTGRELNEYLKAAFELKTIPETLFVIKDAPKKAAIEAIFYEYYKNVAGKVHGTQKHYAALLGDYFEGYKTDTVSSNFSKSVY